MKTGSTANYSATAIARISFIITCFTIFLIILVFTFSNLFFEHSWTLFTCLCIALPIVCFIAFMSHLISFIIARKSGDDSLTTGERVMYTASDIILSIVFICIICFLLDPNPFPLQL